MEAKFDKWTYGRYSRASLRPYGTGLWKRIYIKETFTSALNGGCEVGKEFLVRYLDGWRRGYERARFSQIFATARHYDIFVREMFTEGAGRREWHVEVFCNFID